jgi:hypothetical protein
MPTTLLIARTAVRERLDEATEVFWKDDEIDRWLNEACRDIARATETLRDIATISVTLPTTTTYNLPTDCIQVHNVEYTRTGENTIYPVQPSRISSAEAMGWTNQDTSGIPQMYFTWGFSGSAQLYLWPKPADAGTVTVWYYRLPAEATLDSDNLEIPEGWQDLLYEYCEYKARLKAGDEMRWKASRDEYQQKLVDHLNVTRDMVDQPHYISGGGSQVWWDFDASEGW